MLMIRQRGWAQTWWSFLWCSNDTLCPCHQLSLARQPMGASLSRRLETPGGWHHTMTHRFYFCGIKHWQMSVCCHRAAAVFVIRICSITQRGWRNRMTRCCISFIFQWALCNYKCVSGMHLSKCTHSSENILTCNCPLSPIFASDHNFKRNEVSETRWGRSIKHQICRIIMIFSLPLHMIPGPLLFTSPIPIRELPSSERQITQWAALLAVLSVQ